MLQVWRAIADSVFPDKQHQIILASTDGILDPPHETLVPDLLLCQEGVAQSILERLDGLRRPASPKNAVSSPGEWVAEGSGKYRSDTLFWPSSKPGEARQYWMHGKAPCVLFLSTEPFDVVHAGGRVGCVDTKRHVNIQH
jgi:hypothetical protein